MGADYESENFSVKIQDSGVPSGGRFVAKITQTGVGTNNKTVVRYAYGLTYDEALENGKKLISEYR